MTGGETAAAAAVGKVVKHAGEQLSDEHKNVKQELLSAAKASPHMMDAANNYAKTIAIRQAIVTKAYERVAKWFGVATEYFEGDFNKDMAEKLKNVPEENITAPKPSLAAPAMQHLAYSLDEPNLKDMYLTLLATASNVDSSEDAHPSFVEVVKQLSSQEASLLDDVLSVAGAQPIVMYTKKTQGLHGYISLQRHIMQTVDLDTQEPGEVPRMAAYIDNWIRLGLVEVDYSARLTAPDGYDWVNERPEHARLRASLKPTESIDVLEGILQRTDFGAAFSGAVGISER